MAATAGRGNGGRFSGGMVAGCLALLLALAGCSRDPGGQLPEAGGEKLQAKRDKTVEALNKMPGVECPTPDGSFYVFPDIRGTGMTAQQFADYMIENYQVGVVAGSAFGDRGEGHIRLTYACPDDVLEEGLDRIRQGLENL